MLAKLSCQLLLNADFSSGPCNGGLAIRKTCGFLHTVHGMGVETASLSLFTVRDIPIRFRMMDAANGATHWEQPRSGTPREVR